MTGATRAVTMVAAFAAGVALVGTGATALQKKGGCVMAGGEATMITSGLAEFWPKPRSRTPSMSWAPSRPARSS
jgi:hypothetical protein